MSIIKKALNIFTTHFKFLNKKILIYYSANNSTIAIESIIILFKKQGHKLYLLTQAKTGELHYKLENEDIITKSIYLDKKVSILYYFLQ